MERSSSKQINVRDCLPLLSLYTAFFTLSSCVRTHMHMYALEIPIFAEIVPERARTSIYALDLCFETLLASFAPLLIGTLAQQVFGYKPITEGSSSSGEIETDRQNAASLAKAMYTAIGIPMVICCSIYSFLYFTYPQDRDRVRLQQIDQTLHFPSEEQQPLLEHDEDRFLSEN
ncbi:hypothetical protein KY285_024299 [Solanum tuberosum]|nr:hypothetical protein KY285_024299 [Solanum tuberosum]